MILKKTFLKLLFLLITVCGVFAITENDIIATARRFRLLYGRELNTDSAGVVMFFFMQFGINLPRTATAQSKRGIKVKGINNLEVGDLIFYQYRGSVNDVALYLGNNRIMYCPKPGRIVEENLKVKNLYDIRRIVQIQYECGLKHGDCPSGYCCGKSGICGKTAEYCSVEEGCQSEFGDCRCGEGFGNCPSEQCCSKSGICGETSEFCSVEEGCQSEFGRCDNTSSVKEIIDISKFNEISDYDKAATAVDGVIIRAGYRGYGEAGVLVKDPKLDIHYEGFNGKIKIGYYFFSQARNVTEGIEEADALHSFISDKAKPELPIFWDTERSADPNGEGRADDLDVDTRTECAIAFINRIRELGYKPGIYASEYWYKDNLDYERIV